MRDVNRGKKGRRKDDIDSKRGTAYSSLAVQQQRKVTRADGLLIFCFVSTTATWVIVEENDTM